MAAPIPSTEPASLVAGDTATWTRSLSDYSPADGWALSYAFRYQNGGGILLDVTASTSGGDFAVTIPAASTNQMKAGLWIWAAYVTLGSARYQVATGRTDVKPNLAAIDHSVDLRSSAKKAYDHAIAAWETFATAKSVTLNGRTYTARDAGDLIAYVDRCRADYALEQQAEQLTNTGVDRRRIGVRFARV